MFPTWLYHRHHEARLVRSAAEEAALEPGEWRDTPAQFLNVLLDCCELAALTRGYRHARGCTWPAKPAVDLAPLERDIATLEANNARGAAAIAKRKR